MHAHCYRADEILMLIRVADDYGFKIRTFQHVLEGYKVAKEIAAHGAGASTFSDWWGYQDGSVRRDSVQRRDHDEERRAGLSINSDYDELMRHLNTEAAKTMKYGGMSPRRGAGADHHQSGEAAWASTIAWDRSRWARTPTS